jgi:4-amino-4-deoxy-L-arabinose transferase-like glycosyltransferase
MTKNNKIVFGIMLLLASFPIFYGLTTTPIIQFDEARLAHNAYEMYQNGFSLKTTYENKVDMWNTKPPLLVWIQAALIHLFGPGELPIRLPSAVATLVLCALIFKFVFKHSKSLIWSFLSAMALATFHGFIALHVSRTGDYDALLTLWVFIYSSSLFNYTQTQQNKYLYRAALFLGLAVLTKSIAGFLVLPGIACYFIVHKQIAPILKNKHSYISFLIATCIIVSYYISREIVDSGYFAQVIENEFGGRYLKTLEKNEQPFHYYFSNIKIPYWIIFLPFSLWWMFRNSNSLHKNILVFGGLTSLCFLLILSGSQTKLNWYDVQVYPWLAILVAYPLFRLYSLLEERYKWVNNPIFSITFCTIVLLAPYINIVNKVIDLQDNTFQVKEYHMSQMLIEGMQGKRDITNSIILSQNYNAQQTIYMEWGNQLQQLHIQIIEDYCMLQENTKVLVDDKNIMYFIRNNFEYKILQTHGVANQVQVYNRITTPY